MDLPIPNDIQGRSMVTADQSADSKSAQTDPASEEVYSEEEKKALEDRLKALGYL